jgi:hypothetical protein
MSSAYLARAKNPQIKSQLDYIEAQGFNINRVALTHSHQQRLNTLAEAQSHAIRVQRQVGKKSTMPQAPIGIRQRKKVGRVSSDEMNSMMAGRQHQQYKEIDDRSIFEKYPYARTGLMYAPHLMGFAAAAGIGTFMSAKPKQISTKDSRFVKRPVKRPTRRPLMNRTYPARKAVYKAANATYHNPQVRKYAKQYVKARYPKVYNVYDTYNAFQNPKTKIYKRKNPYKKRKY